MRSICYRRKPFTLIELLVVMVIIVLLAGMLMAGTYGVMRKMRESKALAQIEAMELAFEQYKNDRGYYPQSGSAVMAITNTFVSSITNSSTGRPLINVNDMGMSIVNGLLSDPWGNPWYYQTPGTRNAQKFDLFSFGADGFAGDTTAKNPANVQTATGTNVDDITNWKRR